jgi:hypothetical protein
MNTWWKRLAIISMFAAGRCLRADGWLDERRHERDDRLDPSQHQREREQRLLDGHRLDGRNQLGLDGL